MTSELSKDEHNNNNDDGEQNETRKEQNVNPVRILIFDILFPVLDICIDVTKAMMMLFDYDDDNSSTFSSLGSFANHFNRNGVYGVISLLIKWSPAIVTILHFQDLHR